MTIEEKAHECYEKNRELKPKYHIDEEAWMDWFEEGYKRAQEDQPKIKPLEFKNGIAITPIGEYSIVFSEEERVFDVRINREWHDSFNSESDAIEYCNKCHSDLIMSCFTNTEDHE